MKICSNYRQFKKIRRKYKADCKYYVLNIEQAKSVMRSKMLDNSLKSMLSLFIANYQHLVKCPCGFGTLQGVVISNLGNEYIVCIESKEVVCGNELLAI